MSKEALLIVYSGRSAELEVTVRTPERVMHAVIYDKLAGKTYFIALDGCFIETQEFTETPAEGER